MIRIQLLLELFRHYVWVFLLGAVIVVRLILPCFLSLCHEFPSAALTRSMLALIKSTYKQRKTSCVTRGEN